MSIQKKRDEIMSAFLYENIKWETHGLYHVDGGEWNVDLDILKSFLQTSLNEITDAAYREGRDSILAELAHDQQKFLDGFAHPKECGECEKS